MNKPKVSKAKAKAKKPAARKSDISKAKASKPAARKRSASDNQKMAQLVEEAIDQGANTAEEIHRAVMDMPITVLESLGLGSTAAKVKKVQNSSIGALYELVHEINHSVARLAKDVLKQRKSTKK